MKPLTLFTTLLLFGQAIAISNARELDFKKTKVLKSKKDAKAKKAKSAKVAKAHDASPVDSDGSQIDNDGFSVSSFDGKVTKVPAWMREMLMMVAWERIVAGVGPLCYNAKLIAAAQRHADDMARNNLLYIASSTGRNPHIGSDNSEFWDRTEDAGYDGAAGENIAGGKTVREAMNGWMKSPGHRSNMLNSEMTHFGAGKNGDNWVQLFGNTRGETCNVHFGYVWWG